MLLMTSASNSFASFSWFSASWSHSSKNEFKNLKRENIFKITKKEFIIWLVNIPIKTAKLTVSIQKLSSK